MVLYYTGIGYNDLAMESERFKYLADKYYYSEKHYLEKVSFIESFCTHTEGPTAGEPLILAPFQKEDILKPAFGLFLDSSCRKRLIRKVYVQMPRGNAKTTLLAAIQLAMLFNDGEFNKHIYNCAGSDDQAGILFETARAMVRQSPKLKALVKGNSYNTKLLYESVDCGIGFLEKITSKSDTKHGLKAFAWTYDEIHIAKKRDLYDTLSSGMGKRLNTMGWCITTPGFDKQTICYYLYDRAMQISRGVLNDDRFLGVVYGSEINVFEMDPEKDKKEILKIIREANPLYDYSEPLRDDLESELIPAFNDYHEENIFRRLRLGMWTEAVSRPWSTKAWMECKQPLDISYFKGQEAYMGINFTTQEELVSLAIYFPSESAVFLKYWITEDEAIRMETAYNIPFKRWQTKGLISFIPGNTIDPVPITRQILEWDKEFNIKAVGYEKEFRMTLGGLVDNVSFEYRQSSSKTYKHSSSIEEFKSLINTHNIKHNGDEVLTWMQDNAQLKTNESKEIKFLIVDDEKKIGGLVAITLALYECQMDKANPTTYNFLPSYDVKI